ncbi:MAG: hypothetical protein ACRENI_01705 [Gemmatimonadaceae bacterium]
MQVTSPRKGRAIPAHILRHWVAPAVALIVAALGFLPLANWIPGGHSVPLYAALREEWLSATAIVAGGGLIAAILARRIPFLGGTRPAKAIGRVMRAIERRPLLAVIFISLAALTVYVIIAHAIFSASPLLIDEIVQLYQADIFLDGRLWRPVAEPAEFFSIMHVVDTEGRVYSQFPPGGPALLALGAVVNAPWLVGPVSGAVSVAAFAAYLRVAEPRRGVALGATLLFAFAPFVAFMSGSHMNHVTTLTCLLIALASMSRVVTSPSPRPAIAALSGFSLGLAATIRPVDAFVYALPAGVWFLSLAFRDRRRWIDVLAAGAGVALPMLVMLWVNAETTGAPFRFGYEVLWGKAHAMGFHAAPWGPAHTPARGLELINIYFLRLQTYLFEASLPGLIPFIGALAIARRLDAFDRYLLASAGLLTVFYFAYWHDGYYLGPRFMLPLAPMLALWTARFPVLLRDRLGDGLPYRSVLYGYAIAGLIAVGVGIPLRGRNYAAGLVTMRWDADSAAAAAGVEGAVVLVRESWGAQVMARMWGLGIPRTEAELIYQHTDTCILDAAVHDLERGSARGMSAFEALRPLLRDSARVVGTTYSSDRSQRVLPGTRYSPHCIERLREDRGGFTLLPPLVLARGGSNTYIRDLHERNAAVLRRFPDRPVYLLRPMSAAVGAPPVFVPLARDSLRFAWGLAAAGG